MLRSPNRTLIQVTTAVSRGASKEFLIRFDFAENWARSSLTQYIYYRCWLKQRFSSEQLGYNFGPSRTIRWFSALTLSRLNTLSSACYSAR